jgi:hypothetical protein
MVVIYVGRMSDDFVTQEWELLIRYKERDT